MRRQALESRGWGRHFESEWKQHGIEELCRVNSSQERGVAQLRLRAARQNLPCLLLAPSQSKISLFNVKSRKKQSLDNEQAEQTDILNYLWTRMLKPCRALGEVAH